MCFVNNSEYSNKLVVDGTLLGYCINPYLRFCLSKHLWIDAGFSTKCELGSRNACVNIKPTCTLQYIKNDFFFLFGNFDWQENHRLINPLFNSDYKFQYGREAGIQLKYSAISLFLDIWIDWQTVLQKSYNVPEEFVTGASFYYNIIDNDKFICSLPLQVLLYHLGGREITVQSYSLFCSAVGKKIVFSLSNYFLKNISWGNYYLQSNYINTNKRPFKKGVAYFTALKFDTKWLSIEGSYWYGNGFSLEWIGNPIYSSIKMMQRGGAYYEKVRSLLFLNIAYPFYFGEEVACSFSFEPHYDFLNKLLEHAVHFSVSYNLCYLL